MKPGPALIAAALALLVLAPLAAASPRTNYLLYCSGCHGTDGSSRPPNVPTLRSELGRLVAVPGGRDYLVRVPGASHSPLDDAQLAEVMNWVLGEFNADTLPAQFSPLTTEEVAHARRQVLMDPLKHRAEIYKPYDE